jgi:hypothetical protein
MESNSLLNGQMGLPFGHHFASPDDENHDLLNIPMKSENRDCQSEQ